MDTMAGRNAVVIGSRGLGLGITEALVSHGVRVTVVGRDAGSLDEVRARQDVATKRGDATDASFAEAVLREVRPDILVMMNAAVPAMGSIDTISWEDFSASWNADVKAGLHWVQAALRLPLPRGSRVLLGSSGAAIQGSPLSGGYAGAKRMLWLMAKYANGVALERDLGMRFQALVPRQILGATEHGRRAAAAYASRKGVDVDTFLAGFGKTMSARDVGDHVVTILTDSRYESAVALGLKGDEGIQALEG